MSNDDTIKNVHTFQKNALDEVRASVCQYKGKEYVDLRVYYDQDGERKPSKKGLMLSIELLKELETAVKKLRAAVGSD